MVHAGAEKPPGVVSQLLIMPLDTEIGISIVDYFESFRVPIAIHTTSAKEAADMMNSHHG